MSLKEQVERDLGLPVGESTAKAYSVTYEPYVSITHGGVKEQGESTDVWCETREAAQNLLLLQIREHARAAGPDAVLYWRTEPEVHLWAEHPMYLPEIGHLSDYPYLKPVKAWGGFARLLISDKPVSEEAA